MDKGDGLVDGDVLLLARLHILQRDGASLHFVFADQSHEGHAGSIGVGHLLLHLRAVGIDFRGNACAARLHGQAETMGGFGRTEIDEEELRIGGGRGDSKIYPRIWLEGQLSKKLSMEIGRKWRGMGFQNVAFGEDTDGFTFNYKPNDSDLTLSAYYWKPDKKDVNQLALAGLALKGTVGHGTQLQLNYARANVEKDGSTVVGYNEYYDLGPVTWAFRLGR